MGFYRSARDPYPQADCARRILCVIHELSGEALVGLVAAPAGDP